VAREGSGDPRGSRGVTLYRGEVEMLRTVTPLLVLAVLASCVDDDGPVFGGARVAVSVAALDLPGVGDVIWDLEVANGAGQVVSQRRLTSTGYGDGAGSASYVAPCDAAPDVADNVVRVWVVGVYDAPVPGPSAGSFASGATTGAGAVSATSLEFENPTRSAPLARTVRCAEGADAAATFDVTLGRPARQGFFDVAVAFDAVFCSAKLDCCRDQDGTPGCASDGSEDLRLLFDADGARGRTFVLGFACTAAVGAGVDTVLYLDDLELDCTSPAPADFDADLTIRPDGSPAGNLCTPAEDGVGSCAPWVTELGSVDADDVLFQVATFRGGEQLQSGGTAANKAYWNVALGVKAAVSGCRLRARGTVDDHADDGDGFVDGAVGAGVVYPYVRWDVPLGSCASEALTLGDPDATVRVEYTGTGEAGTVFARSYAASLLQNPIPVAIAPAAADVAVGGQVVFAATGGDPPYTYTIVAGPGSVAGATYTAPGTPGTATVRVTDAFDVTSDATVTIHEALGVTPATATVLVGAQQSFAPTGGLGPFTWSVVAGGGSVSDGIYTAPGAPGAATVRVTDALGQTADAAVSISAPLSLAPASVVLSPGASTTFSASGGVPPYTYTVVSGGGSFSGATYTAPSSGSTAVVRVTDAVGATATANVTLNAGSVAFTTAGSHAWVVPSGVTVIHAVVVGGGGGGAFSGVTTSPTTGGGGGGGLAYRNNISVTPGQTLTVIVGAGGASGFSSWTTTSAGGNGGTSQIVGYLSASGGSGGRTNSTSAPGGVGSGGTANRTGGAGAPPASGTSSPGGGGGAAGYNGNGGAAATTAGASGAAGSGGGGGGGSAGFSGTGYGGGAGGGVGILGVGASGAGGVYTGNPSGVGSFGGGGGSGGVDGGDSGTGGGGAGGAYGGGGAGGRRHPTVVTGWRSAAGGGGAVRIIWGAGRSFPNNAN